MIKRKVLFVCIHNSARSQMAETFLNDLGKDGFTAYSAGLEPGKLNPYVVQAMAEIGYDISHNETNSVWDFIKKSDNFDTVITVCDESSAEACPIFPGNVKREHWSFADPSSFEGNEEEKLAFTKQVRDEIKQRITLWLSEQK